MKSIELFAGAGGLAMAVGEAGFKHAAVLEWDQFACDTIRENQRRQVDAVRDWPVHRLDVRQFDYGSIGAPIDLVSGGPPCQPFSLGGKHRAYRDDRDMFPEAVRAVRELAPRAFVFENVRGLLRQSFATYFEYILLQLAHPEIARVGDQNWPEHLARLEQHHTRGQTGGLKYNVVFQLLNAADYGVPQRRERVFIVGFRSDLGIKWSFPQPTHSQDALLWQQWVSGEYWERHDVPPARRPELPARLRSRIRRLEAAGAPPVHLPWRTVRDALAGLPDPVHGSGGIPNHDLNPGARVYPGHTGSPLDEPGKTLKAGDHGVPGGENMIAFPNGEVRYFTIRESARLQTFPDNFYFPGSWTESMRQLGNAVPTGLGAAVAGAIKAVLPPLVQLRLM
jgi:DNA (cytosine-5)-methyltransferase 1